MKALIYKELKLAMHPMCYVFVFVFPLMVLIPSFPIGVGFIYILTCYPVLFLGANKGQQSNDLLYTTLLPVRKKDIVLARIITVLLMQTAFILMTTLLCPLASWTNALIAEAMEKAKAAGESVKEMRIPGLGLNSYALLLAFCLVGYGFADLVFFPSYYRTGKTIFGAGTSHNLWLCDFHLHHDDHPSGNPDLRGLNAVPLGIQFAILAGAIAIWLGLHAWNYKISAKRFEKVDF